MIPEVSVHVLDTSQGKPAAGVTVTLEVSKPEGGWKEIGKGTTNAGGRVPALGPQGVQFGRTLCRLRFDTGTYFVSQGVDHFFYYEVIIHFWLADSVQNYHIPLLLSPFGYTTYLGN